MALQVHGKNQTKLKTIRAFTHQILPLKISEIIISYYSSPLTFKNCANARWVLQAVLTVSMAFAKLFTYPLYASRTIDLQNCGE